jgi:hypothetical protein
LPEHFVVFDSFATVDLLFGNLNLLHENERVNDSGKSHIPFLLFYHADDFLFSGHVDVPFRNRERPRRQRPRMP